MLFSEETDRKCFSMKWGDKSDVHCAKPSCAEVLPCTTDALTEGSKNAFLKTMA